MITGLPREFWGQMQVFERILRDLGESESPPKTPPKTAPFASHVGAVVTLPEIAVDAQSLEVVGVIFTPRSDGNNVINVKDYLGIIGSISPTFDTFMTVSHEDLTS